MVVMCKYLACADQQSTNINVTSHFALPFHVFIILLALLSRVPFSFPQSVHPSLSPTASIYPFIPVSLPSPLAEPFIPYKVEVTAGTSAGYGESETAFAFSQEGGMCQ